MAIDGKHGVGRAAEVLGEYQQADLDIIGLQETRRDRQSHFKQADYVVYCSGASGDKGDGKGQGGVGLAIRETITAYFLETNYIQTHLSILTQYFGCSPHPMLPVNRHSPHVIVKSRTLVEPLRVSPV